ncbi:Putative periplasmic protein [hydrothermal vent metagenome]|uniref:Putative periplasmic protein n=1 Tax=hydrothermal vent metagenome TaxID=652676 RepID=A0A1W1C4G9_9ZZZZ
MRLSRYLLILVAMVVGFSVNLSASKEYKYSYLPKKVYENQLFPITIIGIESDSSSSPKFEFDQSSKNQPIFKKPLIVQNGDDTFYTFYFKADEKIFHLPSLHIESGDKKIDMESSDIPIVRLKDRDDFSGVLAADMKIRTSQASTYDEENNLVTISIEAFEANIEDMYLKMVKEDGVENVKRDNAKVVAEYYAVVPSTQKNLKFTYFNTIKGQYLFLNVPIVIRSYSVSTQSEINPKDDSFDKLKKYTFIAFSIFFLLMFVWRRDFFYLILAALTLITLLTFYRPKEKICVEQGAPLYILPTDNSRISTKIDTRLDTPLLGKRLEFNKIEYKNKMIGWIKDEDICKD